MSANSPTTQILFVTGKGGVGKSSVALAYAMRFAEQGRRTLLVEMGYRSYLADFLGRPELVSRSPEPAVVQPLAAHLDAVCWSGEQCLRDYIVHYLKIERLYRIFFENRVMKALVDVAPGLKEISLLGKITSGVRHVGPEFTYQRIVVDCFATGHALAFFQAPQSLAESIGVGPMAEQSRSIDRVLRDPERCSYKIVTLLEELPVTETIELASELHRLLGVKADVIANKVLELPFAEKELYELRQDPRVKDFALFLDSTLKRQNHYRHELQTHTVLEQELPLLFDKDPWALARHLTARLA